MDGGGFAHHVHHEEQFWRAGHLAHAAQQTFQALDHTGEDQGFLLGNAAKIAAVAHALQALQLVDALADGAPVGQHAAQPAGRDVRHRAARGLELDGLLSLALGAQEQYRAAIGDDIAHHNISLVHGLGGFLQVNDVDAVAFGEDIGLHRGVPLVRAVTKVNARFEQSLHGDNCHIQLSPSRFSSAFVNPSGNRGDGDRPSLICGTLRPVRKRVGLVNAPMQAHSHHTAGAPASIPQRRGNGEAM